MPSLTKPLTVINMLYKDCIYIIQRDIAHIKTLAIGATLPPSASKALIGYAKLLGELKAAHEAIDSVKKAKRADRAKGVDEATLLAKVNEPLK